MTEKPQLPDLLPCPLCGKLPRFYLLAAWWTVRCDNCGLRLEKKETSGGISALWNKRWFNSESPEPAVIHSPSEIDFDKVFGNVP